MIVVNQNEIIGPWVAERVGGKWTPGRGHTLGWMDGGKLLAGVLVEDWNGACCTMHVAGEGTWAYPKFIDTVFDYVFGQLKCRCTFAVVSSVNEKCLRLCLRLGYEEVVRLKEAHPDGDLVLLRLWREAWENRNVEAKSARCA